MTKLAIRNGAIFLALFLAAHLLVPFGGVAWAAWFLNDHIYPVSLGWVSWAALVGWCYYALVFLTIGLALAVLVRTSNPHWAALAFGALYSIDWFARSHFHFFETAPAYDYFWVYGEFAVPPVAALLGARLRRRLGPPPIVHASEA